MMTPEEYVNEVIAFFNKHAICRDELRFPGIIKQLKIDTQDAQEVEETHPAIAKAVKAIDKHGSLVTSQMMEEWEATSCKEDIEGGSLGKRKRIAYLKIPGVQVGEKDYIKAVGWATTGQQLIQKMEEEGPVERWIIDLRENTGGALGVMIAALGPFWNEGFLASFWYPRAEQPRWDYQNGSVSFEPKYPAIRYVEKPYRLKNRHVPIDVWIGPKTASAGESLAIIFRSQESLYVRLIGTNTGGYTTAMEALELPDGNRVQISAGRTVDRNGLKYLGGVAPDKVVRKLPASKLLLLKLQKLTARDGTLRRTVRKTPLLSCRSHIGLG